MTSFDVSNRHALYVEDEVLIGLEGKRILLRMGFASVTLAHDLSAACNHVKIHPIDFALLDIDLAKGTTSLDLARELDDAGVPIVFASGHHDPKAILNDFDAPFVCKPFTMRTISAAVTDAMALSQQPQRATAS